MYSFIQIVGGDYNTWTIYLVTEYEIRFLAQKGTEWAYTKGIIFSQK
jgi:hypothetical protein